MKHCTVLNSPTFAQPIELHLFAHPMANGAVQNFFCNFKVFGDSVDAEITHFFIKAVPSGMYSNSKQIPCNGCMFF